MDCAVCTVRPAAAGNGWQHYYMIRTLRWAKEQAWNDNLNKTAIYTNCMLSSNYTCRPTSVSRMPTLSHASSCNSTPNSTSRPDCQSGSHLECCVRDAVRLCLWQILWSNYVPSYLITVSRKRAISITLSTGAASLSVMAYLTIVSNGVLLQCVGNQTPSLAVQ